MIPFRPALMLAARLAARSGQATGGGELSSGEGLASEYDFWGYALRMAAVLALVVGLIILFAWLYRFSTGRRLAFGSGGLMQLVATLPLGDRRFIAVVRVGTGYYLMGISGSDIRLLRTLETEEVRQHLTPEPRGEGGFAAILRRLRGEGGKGKAE